MESFLTSFLMIFTAEMGDKTQFLVFSLSLQYGAIPVLFGAILAFTLLNGPGVFVGELLSNMLSQKNVGLLSGFIFLAFGIYMLLQKKEEERDNINNKKKSGFLISFSTIFIGELGDKTQVCSLLLGAKYKAFFSVFSGCFLALFLATLLGIFLGSHVQKWLPKVPFKKIAGFIMFLTGFFSIFKT